VASVVVKQRRRSPEISLFLFFLCIRMYVAVALLCVFLKLIDY
jgi:hypothetical protein